MLMMQYFRVGCEQAKLLCFSAALSSSGDADDSSEKRSDDGIRLTPKHATF
jgi:hypothetical protein